MFSDLRQNSVVYIFNKQDKLSVETGFVTSPLNNNLNGIYNPYSNINNFIDIEVSVNGKKEKYEKVPMNQNVVSYNNGSTIISDSKEPIITEVENIIKSSENILNNIDYYKSAITDGEEILKSLNPTFAKEKARDEEIDALNKRMSGIDNKLDKLFTILSKSENK